MRSQDFSSYYSKGYSLAVLPISRLHVDMDSISLPKGAAVYATGSFCVQSLKIRENKLEGPSLADVASAATGVDASTLGEHPLIVFPCHFDWNAFECNSHANHMRFLRTLSQYADATFLDVVRYNACKLGLADTLPGRAGSVDSSPMFAAAVLYNPEKDQSCLIAGAAFTHAVTVGLGLALETCHCEGYPRDGEVGRIAKHALALYRNTLEAYDHTSRFIGAMTLLEFLANPEDYERFEKVKKTIAKYVAKDKAEYERWLEWFFDITGRKDPASGVHIGLRTRIVHLGDQLEDLLTDSEIEALYRGLEQVIGSVISHLIDHSELSWDEYLTVRATIGPFS